MSENSTEIDFWSLGSSGLPLATPTGILIDGNWRRLDAGTSMEVIDPATEVAIAAIATATEEDVDAALAAANTGWHSWRKVDAWTRSSILRRVAELLRQRCQVLALVLTIEQGKPVSESTSEVLAAADQFDWCADEARRIYGRIADGHSVKQRLMVRRESIGPVAAFCTWNFPALLPSRKIAPALAAGCSVIIVPADETPLTAALIAQTCLDAGVHPAAISVLTGNPEMVSERLIRSSVVRKISLTGSIPVGRKLLHLAADRIIPATMELGGHAPVLVFEDADVDAAARACVQAKFRNTGQVCAAPSRFFVQEGIADEFIDRFVTVTESLKVGNGRDPETNVGPLTNERRRSATERLVSDAVSKGAHVLAGGGRDPHHSRGYFFSPTVLSEVSSHMEIMRDEPFAPVAPISRFSDIDSVLNEANSTPFGLASFIFTRNLSTAFQAAEGLEAGMVGINTMLIASAEAPFGGVKQSGYGREGGSEGIESFLVDKYFSISL
jgi:succinate-semialdehyde dehydrogenase/glutarate-semialdehyde dehydrogenase